MKKGQLVILFFIAAFYLGGCAKNVTKNVFPTLSDGKYDNEFPYKNCSSQLEEISKSIQMVNSIGFYNIYIFDKNENLLNVPNTSKELFDRAIAVKKHTQTASGTATVIKAQFGQVALLTCAHTVYFKDTLITYFVNDKGKQSNIIESISVKTNQSNYIAEFPEGGDVDILVVDEEHDLAIIGKNFKNSKWSVGNSFTYPIGRADELEWGSFVYAFGFPLNQRVISKGIVSSPNSKDGSFIVDAVFNPGFSGGILLAIRDGVPNFELVGMIKSAPANYEYFLKPDIEDENFVFNPSVPYTGDVVVEYRKNIHYGLVKAIPIEQIVDFIVDSDEILKSKGFNISNFGKM